LQGAADGGHVGFAKPLRDVKASDFRNRDRVGLPGNQLDFIASGNLALAGDGEIQTGAGA
jgi:hypothetical protein